ncbi:MAG: hypothetical protein KDC38_20280, partial [Planctomycetes bacterium]|nr:hypothetical protein [Planctomycetota bacterium]
FDLEARLGDFATRARVESSARPVHLAMPRGGDVRIELDPHRWELRARGWLDASDVQWEDVPPFGAAVRVLNLDPSRPRVVEALGRFGVRSFDEELTLSARSNGETTLHFDGRDAQWRALRVRVVDPEGGPLSNVPFWYCCGLQALAFARTDDRGFLELRAISTPVDEFLEAEEYPWEIDSRPLDARFVSEHLEVTSSTKEIRLHRGAHVSIELREPGGRRVPVRGLDVALLIPAFVCGGAEFGLARDFAEIDRAADARRRVLGPDSARVSAGEYRLTATTADGWSFGSVDAVELQEDETRVLEWEIPPAVVTAIQVRRGGAPCANAVLQLSRSGPGDWDCGLRPRTDDHGVARVPLRVRGAYSVELVGGRAPSSSVNIVPGEPTEVDLPGS